jgi:UDP-glucose 4-epimerase
MDRILVTGGAGFIGSHLVDRLLMEGYEVVVFDNLSTGSLDNIPLKKNKNLSFIKGDIRDGETVKKALKDIDAVFHEAALVSVVLSVKDPILSNAVNVDGTLNLLQSSVELGVRKFVFASSGAVYGKHSGPIRRESMRTFPSNPYGITKLAGENYAKAFYKLYGLETVCLRNFNVYGPRQSFSIENCYGGVITLFFNRLLLNLPPIVYGDGEQSRDFVYVNDVVEANMLALNCKSASGECFNIGGGKETSVNKVSEILRTLLNKKDLKNVYEKPRLGEERRDFADITKASSILGFHPRFSFDQGIRELVDWYINRHHSVLEKRANTNS